MKAMQDGFFRQLVDFPTHIKGNILDLVITNIPEKVSELKEVGRIGKSDHVILQFDLTVSADKEVDVATGITKVAKSPFALHSHLLRKVVT